jgi:anti-sigma regulatory factor (Ser/Thr protein kinase)
MTGSRVLWSFTIDRASSATIRRARSQFASVLGRTGVSRDDREAATLILGELLANACEHGCAPVQVQLHEQRGRYTLSVADSGRGIVRPRQRSGPESLRGRGFEIVEKLGGRLAIAPPPESSVRVGLPIRTDASR